MPKRILEGDVVSNKTDKTVTVLVERRYMHPMYKKYVKRTDKYAAHDESNKLAVGDRVRIQECRPISKTKRWTVITGDEAQAAPKAKTEKKAKPAAKKTEAKDTKKDDAKSETKAKKAPAKKKAAPKKEAAKKAPAKKTAAKKKTTEKKSEKKDS